MSLDNPFSFSAANDLKADDLLYYYIPEHNHSRFIESKRNVLLLGERGTGKTMTLLYHTLELQQLRAKRDRVNVNLGWVGVYVPCNTPLIRRTDHELLDEYRAFVLSEHFLALSVVKGIVQSLERAVGAFGEIPDAELVTELEAVLAAKLPADGSFIARLGQFVALETRRTQIAINEAANDFYPSAFSFATLVIPVLEVLSRIPALAESHFLLMLDDADYLNAHQSAALNSWISYRDHSRFSFKVATSKVTRQQQITASGGSIAEGHDFTVVDMENPLQNEKSDFGRLARDIVTRRLQRINSGATPEQFFPVSPSVVAQLEDCKREAASLAAQKYPQGTQKQISDFVYKYHRALFFRRKAQANRPVYSGFDMITYLSTGVVRNLLEPCYAMFDKALSRAKERKDAVPTIGFIDPTIQSEVILALSERPWEKISDGLHNHVANCTKAQSDQLKRLFEGLAQLFRQRLLSDCSEPRATSFTVSGGESDDGRELDALLTIARKALLLYVRRGPAKDSGSRESYFVPTRMLWPARGLDPLGQHARVSLKATDLMAVARDEAYPWAVGSEAGLGADSQGTLFDGRE